MRLKIPPSHDVSDKQLTMNSDALTTPFSSLHIFSHSDY